MRRTQNWVRFGLAATFCARGISGCLLIENPRVYVEAGLEVTSTTAHGAQKWVRTVESGRFMETQNWVRHDVLLRIPGGSQKQVRRRNGYVYVGIARPSHFPQNRVRFRDFLTQKWVRIAATRRPAPVSPYLFLRG